MADTTGEITRLLDEWSEGDADALERLLPLVIDDVREMARRALQGESSAHTLQPTALVNEVYLRLTGRRTVQWCNRQHFFGTLSDMMRRILVDHARRRLSAKRGSGGPKVVLDEGAHAGAVRPDDLVALDDALAVFADVDRRKCEVVKLRFFVGLTHEEIAKGLDISVNTVDRDWRAARMWLRRELDRKGEEN